VKRQLKTEKKRKLKKTHGKRKGKFQLNKKKNYYVSPKSSLSSLIVVV
jgi:hypothetical protein